MARVKRARMSHKRHKRVLKRAEGYWGRKKSNFRIAYEQLMKSGQYAYRDRRNRKRDFRRLWIVRISAACHNNETKYSHFMNGLKRAGIQIDRKALSDLAIFDPPAFTALVERARSATA
ncbi:MAG: 50S ribosomal protein L20 [Armatimonadetes bacterium]|nr:50S ribosomal protein L20 [Armatimonadota bacterium]